MASINSTLSFCLRRNTKVFNLNQRNILGLGQDCFLATATFGCMIWCSILLEDAFQGSPSKISGMIGNSVAISTAFLYLVALKLPSKIVKRLIS